MYDNEINENNLIYLNDELSNLREEILLTTESIHQDNFDNIFKLKKDLNIMNPPVTDQKNYYKMKVEELSKIIIGKNSLIKDQNEIINNLNHAVKAYKEKNNQLKTNIRELENSREEVNCLGVKLREKESEIRQINDKYTKMTDKIKEKEKLLNDFQGLVSICNMKFQNIEDKNKEYIDEISTLKKKLEILEEKLKIYESEFNSVHSTKAELNKKKSEFNQAVEIHNIERKIQEENLKKFYEKAEGELKENLRIKEEEIKEEFLKKFNKLSLEFKEREDMNKKYIRENEILNEKLNEFSYILREKETLFLDTLDKKDIEKVKLMEIINDVNAQITSLEDKYSNKLTDLQNKVDLLTNELDEKNRKLLELVDENTRLNIYTSSLENENKLIQDDVLKKNSSLNLMKNQHIELMKEFNSRFDDFEKTEMSRNNNLDLLTSKLEEKKDEEAFFLRENEDLKMTVQIANARIKELLCVVTDYKMMEENLKFVLNENKRLEKRNEELLRKGKETEEKAFTEISKYRRFISLKEEELSNLKEIYENKLIMRKVKKKEMKTSIQRQNNEIKNLKEIITNLENNKSYLNENIVKSESSQVNIEKDYFANLENLKNIISKVENKFI